MRGSTNITLAAAQERSGDIVEVDRAICGVRCGVGLHLPAPVEPTKKILRYSSEAKTSRDIPPARESALETRTRSQFGNLSFHSGSICLADGTLARGDREETTP
jgi:hypothetical protein